jgi:hypothetical protein
MTPSRTLLAAALIAAAVLVASIATAPGRVIAGDFLGSLRIATPPPVNARVSAPVARDGGRQILAVIVQMIADTANTTLDEPPHPVPTVDSAERLAGFATELPRTRTDAPRLIVLGAHDVRMTVHRDQLQTVLAEAGESADRVPAQVDGAAVVVRMPRALELDYGRCPGADTVPSQSPLSTADSTDCVILTETPAVSADVPPGLDMAQLYRIALELYGLSPDQAQAFQQVFDWHAVLGMTLPRFMRSAQSAVVNGAPAIMLLGGSRRGPAYAVMWRKDSLVFLLTGFGRQDAALPLASATR